MIHELTFTDWNHYTDGDGNAKTIDWSNVATMQGTFAYPNVEALRQAVAHRKAFFVGHPGANSITDIDPAPQPHDLGWMSYALRAMANELPKLYDQENLTWNTSADKNHFPGVDVDAFMRPVTTTMDGVGSGYNDRYYGAGSGDYWTEPDWYLTRARLISDTDITADELATVEALPTAACIVPCAALLLTMKRILDALCNMRHGNGALDLVSCEQKQSGYLATFLASAWGPRPGSSTFSEMHGDGSYYHRARTKWIENVDYAGYAAPEITHEEIITFPCTIWYIGITGYQQNDYPGWARNTYDVLTTDPAAEVTLGDFETANNAYLGTAYTGHYIERPNLARYYTFDL